MNKRVRVGFTLAQPLCLITVILLFLAGRPGNAYAQTLTNLYSFVGPPNDGANPQAGLVQGSDGNFYGTTLVGGTSNFGSVFRVSPSGSYTNLYTFVGPGLGAAPTAGLVQGTDSKFYGTTEYGGNSGFGNVYRISPSGGYTNLYSFVGYPSDGNTPTAGLVRGSDGNFYGTTYFGGTSNFGSVYRISPSGSYTNLYSFVGSPNDGANPYAGLVPGSDGNLYGTTYSGGTGNFGSVYRISPGASHTNLHFFVGFPGDGANPASGLVQGSDGNFYGTAFNGGANNFGTVYRISPSGSHTNLYSFVGSPNDGANPQAGLVQGSDGNFYGTTLFGQTSNFGSVYRISPGGSYTNLYSFEIG